MNDLHLHLDRYDRAALRGDRASEDWARRRSLERAAQAARAVSVETPARAGRRTRLIGVTAPSMALALALALVI